MFPPTVILSGTPRRISGRRRRSFGHEMLRGVPLSMTICSAVRRSKTARACLETLERRLLLAVGVLDTIVFGNSASEQAHTFSGNSTQIISGNLGQSARQELPLSPAQVNGGDMTFTLAVDP